MFSNCSKLKFSFKNVILVIKLDNQKDWINILTPNSLFRGDVTSSNNNKSAIFKRWKSNLKWWMFHRLNDKGDNSLTEIPGKENWHVYGINASGDETCEMSQFTCNYLFWLQLYAQKHVDCMNK